MTSAQEAFSGIQPRWALWPHQQRAIDAFKAGRRRGGKATYLVIPPGGGKTLIGLEAARRLGRPTVVLCPNTAIQAQWIDQWHTACGSAAVEVTASRDLPTPLTVLTYQAVSTFDTAPGRDSRLPDERLLDALHPNGRQLLARLSAAGPCTLVLDECHHLLEIWGRLLRAIIRQLDDPYVLGLTATPPHLMTAGQTLLHKELFGAVDLEVATPSLVLSGRLAPYRELAWFTTPTPAEADYVTGQALRFAELRADLLAPDFGSVPFLEWLQRRVVERHVDGSGAVLDWARFAKDEPGLADAALRLHADGLLPLPDGARPRAQHRRPPDAADWSVLIGDYCKHCLLPGVAAANPRDEAAYAAIRRALPAVGYRLTKTGVRAAESPVDRVLARSEAKTRAAVEILRAEHAELGSRLRALVLTDFIDAGGTVPATLRGVLVTGSGGARLALETLLADPVTAALDPVLLSGQLVACGADTGPALAAALRAASLDVTLAPAASGLVEVVGASGWEPRRYVPPVTAFFAAGGTRCLVGTRALLGEGWDAPAVNVTVDLTAATTPTAVVQGRGRALRTDARWPQKVANNWSVVCVTGAHPKGDADYDRFVRKHDRYFALAPGGEIIAGVAHVDAELSPFAPPEAGADGSFAALNARMLIRAGERDQARRSWLAARRYADEPTSTVVVAAGKPLGAPLRAMDALPALDPTETGGFVLFQICWLIAGVAAAAAVVAGNNGGNGNDVGTGAAFAFFGLLLAWCSVGAVGYAYVSSLVRLVRAGGSQGVLTEMAKATADALHEAGLVSRGGGRVRIKPGPDGSYRAYLDGVPGRESALFAAALDEVIAPLGQPRYIVPRQRCGPAWRRG